MDNVMENFQEHIKDDYFEIIALDNHSKMISFLEEDCTPPYSYNVNFGGVFEEGITLRIDKFLSNTGYIHKRGSKDCDNIIIDTKNKKIYIIEIKCRVVFNNTPRGDFLKKERDTELFLKYLFMITGQFDEFDKYECVFIRWSYENKRLPDRATLARSVNANPYFKMTCEDKEVFKVQHVGTLFLNDMIYNHRISH